MEASNINRRIRIVFVRSLDLNMDPDDPDFPMDLGSVAGLDSLALVTFVADLEGEFQFQIEPDKLNIEFLCDLKALSEYFTEHIEKDSQ
jgi:acyl carrier protein